MIDNVTRRDALRIGAAGAASVCLLPTARTGEKPVTPLARAHAHNDYEHARPLRDALAQGFCSVEADVFLTKDELLVAHERKNLKPGRTLEKLYLDPLRELVKVNRGKVYPDGPAFHLLIDAKTGAAETYAALDRVLARYADVLSVTRDGKFEPKAVTVVVSGNRDKEAMTRQAVRFAGIDGRPEDLESDAPAHLVPWISANWTLLFRWRGDGPMPEAERRKLRGMVEKAHGRGRLVRFWATPETETVWKVLLSAGVDLINTDKLGELRTFLLANPTERKKH
jgi:Glycerophosphoryl diester phosphodiesterase family